MMTMTDKQYDKHFKRIRQMLVDSGDYDGWEEHENAEGAMDADTGLILKSPHYYPEYF